ncbi:MAG: hypothetical protein IPI67_14990 [Myxococcales bacterium]|nr:hypothetical protein [Myxococcales bacterium]
MLSAALLGFWGCKRRTPEVAPSAQPTPSAAPQPITPRCSEPHPGLSFTVGERKSVPAAAGEADEDDDGVDQPALPFAVALGRGVAFGDGFAVSAISTVGKKTSAVVALIGKDGGSGRIATLAQLHADPDPPELSADGSDLIALLHDTDAGGELLRLAAIRPGSDKIDVVLGAEIAESRDESRAADLELGPERGVAVWDEWSRADKHGVVVSASFARADISNVTKKRIVSSPTEDAEAPRIVRRPGGFWAAWIARTIVPKSALAPRMKPAAAPSAAPRPSSGEEPPEPPLVQLGERYLSAVALDANGVALSEPKAVSVKHAHVLVFDLASGPDGSALLAWRDDDTAPGAEERRVYLGTLRADGSVERHVVEDEGVGVGAPALLIDAAAGAVGGPLGWLTLASISDATRIGAVGPSGLIDNLGTEPAIRSAELLAVARGRFLRARPNGLAMELSVVECKPGSAPALPTPAPSASAE